MSNPHIPLLSPTGVYKLEFLVLIRKLRMQPLSLQMAQTRASETNHGVLPSYKAHPNTSEKVDFEILNPFPKYFVMRVPSFCSTVVYSEHFVGSARDGHI
ncbi:hypothetical protein BS47DRAFT_1348387 [Hydnum rufescens UP504]|uniref:Uncharacterized protein n=1 Tax=Hydnum rufescens UP504 TaxID=1448309 RepID=A0A9P6AR19_9AGAM|nr:hypothetical protein BS47DRAFT_1348387 [Hydnum rufescens UP504]